MVDNRTPDSTKRFTGLAEIYSKARPSYPDAAIKCMIDEAKLTPNSVVADIGCGTGISTRLLAERGFKLIGIEPNEDMRSQAEADKSIPGIEYRDGTAEKTGLAAGSVDLIMAAQAFHWFPVDESLAEFHRALKAGGWVALMWNERDERNPFTRAYGDALRMSPETNKVEMHRGKAGEPLLTCSLFVNAHKRTFSNSQRLDAEGVIQRAFSASYAPKDEPGATNLRRLLNDAFERFSQDGLVDVVYETSLYLAQKSR